MHKPKSPVCFTICSETSNIFIHINRYTCFHIQYHYAIFPTPSFLSATSDRKSRSNSILCQMVSLVAVGSYLVSRLAVNKCCWSSGSSSR